MWLSSSEDQVFFRHQMATLGQPDQSSAPQEIVPSGWTAELPSQYSAIPTSSATSEIAPNKQFMASMVMSSIHAVAIITSLYRLQMARLPTFSVYQRRIAICCHVLLRRTTKFAPCLKRAGMGPCTINFSTSSGEKIYVTMPRYGRLYSVPLVQRPKTVFMACNSSNLTDTELWHLRFGHTQFRKIIQASHNSIWFKRPLQGPQHVSSLHGC